MSLFEKKPSAMAMLGSSDSLKILKESNYFESYNINLINKDFVTFDEIELGLKENKNVEYLLISDTALLGYEDGKFNIIKNIRAINDNVFIVFLMNHEKPDEKFIDWAFGYKVYNIYYADSEGSFNFDVILEDLIAKQMPVKQLPIDIALKENELETKEKEILQKETELSERETQLNELQVKLQVLQNCNKDNAQNNNMKANYKNEIEELKQKIFEMHEGKLIAETSIENLKQKFEKEKNAILDAVEKEKKEYRNKIDADAKARIKEVKEELKQSKITENTTLKQKSLGSITIGAFSLSHGAGATYTSAALGELIAKEGYNVAVVAFDDTVDLQYKSKKEKRVAKYIIPKKGDKKADFLQTLNMGFNFVIVDFGCIFDISPFGKLNTGEFLSDKKMEIDEFLRCHYKIGIGFSAPWHEGKLDFFINNNMVDHNNFIFSILGAGSWDRSKKYNLNICERENDVIKQVLFNLIGI